MEILREYLPLPEDYYLSQGLLLKGSGPWRSSVCPFHDDHFPSLRVNLNTGIYRCMVCDAKGDLIHFHAVTHCVSYVEAADLLGVLA